jgi:hypothetical protein
MLMIAIGTWKRRAAMAVILSKAPSGGIQNIIPPHRGHALRFILKDDAGGDNVQKTIPVTESSRAFYSIWMISSRDSFSLWIEPFSPARTAERAALLLSIAGISARPGVALVIAEYLEPGRPCNADETIPRLIETIDNEDLARAIQRLQRVTDCGS